MKKSNKNIFIIIIILLIVVVIGLTIGVGIITSKESREKEPEEVTLTNAGFTKITINKYLEILKGSEKSIILVARPTCHYCEMFTPILKQAKDDMKLNVYYLNTDELDQEGFNTFESSCDYMKANASNWGTPLTLIVQNGEVVDANSGYSELDEIKEFFSKNGFGE